MYEGLITYKPKGVPFLVFNEAAKKGSVKVIEGVYLRDTHNIFMIFMYRAFTTGNII